MPPTAFGYSGQPAYAYDPAKAKSLLADAGYGSGFTMGFDWPTTGFGAKTKEVGTAIAANFAAVGITVTPRALEGAAFGQLYNTRKLSDSYLVYLRMRPLDAQLQYNISLRTGAAYNMSGYSNPRLDALLAQANAILDTAARKSLLEQAEKLIPEDAPWVFLYVPDIAYGMKKGVQWTPRPDALVSVFDEFKAG